MNMSESLSIKERFNRKFDCEKGLKKVTETWESLSASSKKAVIAMGCLALVGSAGLGTYMVAKTEHDKRASVVTGAANFNDFDPRVRFEIAPGVEVMYGALGNPDWSKDCLWQLAGDVEGDIQKIQGQCEPGDNLTFLNTGAKTIRIQEDVRTDDDKFVRREISIAPGQLELSIIPFAITSITETSEK